MNLVTIHDDPDRYLTTPVPETPFDQIAITETFIAMKAAMRAHNGRGLAAPQIGIRSRCILVRNDAELEFFHLPVITYRSKEKFRAKEACLSVPGVTVTRLRSVRITLRGANELGIIRSVEFRHMNAACAQHELDHINGITIAP